MPRKVFFSFDFGRDSRRVAQVRNAHAIGFYDKPPLLDAVNWEAIKKNGDHAIKKWIDDNLRGVSVTIVLIGKETYTRRWVTYEIQQSYSLGKGLLGIKIHNVNDPVTGTDFPGMSPFSNVKDKNGRLLSETVPVYDWINQNGRMSIGLWIETAAGMAGR